MRLSTTPKITADCGQQVTLNCCVSSSRNGLSVKLMEWSLNRTSLCSVGSEGRLTTHHIPTLSDFHCEYEHGQLSLVFREVRPLDSANYRCKLQSKQGAAHKYTAVELQGQSPSLLKCKKTCLLLMLSLSRGSIPLLFLYWMEFCRKRLKATVATSISCENVLWTFDYQWNRL